MGSGPDSLLRELQPDLQKIYNATVIIENRPGGNGAIAFDACNRSAEQKTTLCYTEAAVFWAIPKIIGNDHVTKNLKFFAVSHFAPLVLVTSENITNRQQLIEHIKKHPNFGSWAVGSVGQITGQELVDHLKIAGTQHVPYKDYGQWLLDVANQNLGFSFPTIGSATPLYRAGKIKFIAVATKQRDPVFSDVPTMEEYFPGLKNFVPLGAYGAFYVSRDMPAATEKVLLTGMNQALANPNLKSSLIIRGYRPWTKTDAETRKILTTEQEHYNQALKQFNINLRP